MNYNTDFSSVITYSRLYSVIQDLKNNLGSTPLTHRFFYDCFVGRYIDNDNGYFVVPFSYYINNFSNFRMEFKGSGHTISLWFEFDFSENYVTFRCYHYGIGGSFNVFYVRIGSVLDINSPFLLVGVGDSSKIDLLPSDLSLTLNRYDIIPNDYHVLFQRLYDYQLMLPYKTRLFESDNKYYDDVNSGFCLGFYYAFLYFVTRSQLVQEYSEKSHEYSVSLEYLNYGSLVQIQASGSSVLCQMDFLNASLAGAVIIDFSYDFINLNNQSLSISDLFTFNGPVNFPSSIVCQFYIDCDDCDEINNYFKLVFKAINSLVNKGDDMDYTDVLTQIAQNLSIMSNDVNTNLDNINTNISGIKNNLQYTDNDDVTKGLAEITNENNVSKSVVVETIEKAPFNPYLDDDNNDIYGV